MRKELCALLLLLSTLSACFRWAPTDIATVAKEPTSTVRVIPPNADPIEIEDTKVEDGKVVGIPRDRVRPMAGIDLRPPDIVVADPQIVKLEARRLNGWGTAAIVSGVVLAIGGTVFLILVGVVLASSHAVGFMLPPPAP